MAMEGKKYMIVLFDQKQSALDSTNNYDLYIGSKVPKSVASCSSIGENHLIWVAQVLNMVTASFARKTVRPSQWVEGESSRHVTDKQSI